jgi:hypothetical protein
MSSRQFWVLVDLLQIPDAKALDLIGYPGKLPTSGKRPRFRLTTRQTRTAEYLPEIQAALESIGERPSWLTRRNRSAPFSGRAPLDTMAERGVAGIAEVMQFLNRAVMRKSLR